MTDLSGVDPSASIDSFVSPAAPQVAPPVDALSQGAAPAGIPGSTADPFSPAGMVAPGLSDPTLGGMGVGGDGTGGGTGGGSWATADVSGGPGGYDPTTDTYAGITGTGGDTTTAPPAAPTSTTSTGPMAAPGVGGKTAGPNDPTAGDQPTPLRAGNVQGQADLAGGGAGGAAGANAMTQLANALRGVAQAAQGGNPQAQQLMNMLRQMQMMQQMQGMMGGGQQYNPYMNQFNPMDARRRMEQMRREFMERQRLRRELYPGTPGAAGRPVGARHGR